MEKVVITDPSHRFYGKIGAVYRETPTSYRLILLRTRRPLKERIMYGNKGKVNAIKYPRYYLLISKTKAKKLKGKSHIREHRIRKKHCVYYPSSEEKLNLK